MITIQLIYPGLDKFDPDPSIQEWLKGRTRKMKPGFADSEPKLKRARLQTVELPVAGGGFMER